MHNWGWVQLLTDVMSWEVKGQWDLWSSSSCSQKPRNRLWSDSVCTRMTSVSAECFLVGAPSGVTFLVFCLRVIIQLLFRREGLFEISPGSAEHLLFLKVSPNEFHRRQNGKTSAWSCSRRQKREKQNGGVRGRKRLIGNRKSCTLYEEEEWWWTTQMSWKSWSC